MRILCCIYKLTWTSLLLGSLFLVSCQNVARFHQHDVTMLADFDEVLNFEAFDDKPDFPNSTTIIATELSPGIRGNGVLVTYSVAKPGYCGFLINLHKMNLNPFEKIGFWAQRVEGEVPEVNFQVKNSGNVRKGIPFLETVVPESQFVHYEMDLNEFRKEGEGQLAAVKDVAIVLRNGEGKMLFDSFYVSGKRDRSMSEFKQLEIPPRSSVHLPRGNAAWCYQHDMGELAQNVRTVRARNSQTHGASQIRYLFVHAGSIEFFEEGGDPIFSWVPERALEMARQLQGQAHVLPMIGSQGGEAAQTITSEQWDHLAKQIASVVDSEPLFFGFHFDIEPYREVHHWLYSLLKNYSDKPVTAAVYGWTPDTFRVLDIVVLMAYDRHKTVRGYTKNTLPYLHEILADAQEIGGNLLIGAPLIATHNEYEYMEEISSGRKIDEQPHAMIDFVQVLVGAVKEYTKDDDSGFFGWCYWALHPKRGLRNQKDDTVRIFPTEIPEELFELLESPLQ